MWEACVCWFWVDVSKQTFFCGAVWKFEKSPWKKFCGLSLSCKRVFSLSNETRLFLMVRINNYVPNTMFWKCFVDLAAISILGIILLCIAAGISFQILLLLVSATLTFLLAKQSANFSSMNSVPSLYSLVETVLDLLLEWNLLSSRHNSPSTVLLVSIELLVTELTQSNSFDRPKNVLFSGYLLQVEKTIVMSRFHTISNLTWKSPQFVRVKPIPWNFSLFLSFIKRWFWERRTNWARTWRNWFPWVQSGPL